MWQRHLVRNVVLQQPTPRVMIMASTSHLLQQHSFVATTLLRRFASKTINVPTMGDSITEGTVVEWMVEPGQAVQPDDIVAMVETDKVTIEIKADISGVVTKHFPAVDETVEVGAPLYEIDTEATASVEANNRSKAPDEAPAQAKETPKEEAPKAAATSNRPAQKQQQQLRTPSIHFLGKEGWAARLKGEPVVVLPPIHPNYGRPLISEEEMEAIMLGGAEQAPKIVSYSSGASFA